MMPRVAAVIPCYNRATTVQSSIQSVLDQTRKCDRIIVVDDGSTDDTAQVLAEFGNQITVIRQSNAGVASARNAGVLAADDCDLIAFLDSDDVWRPDKLEHQVPLHDRQGIVLTGTDWVWANQQGESEHARLGLEREGLSAQDALDVLLRFEGHGFWLPTWLVDRRALLRVGMFDPRMKRVEDTRVLFRLAFEGSFDLTKQIGTVRSSDIDAVQLTDTKDRAYQEDYVPATIEVLLETYARAWQKDPTTQQQLRQFVAYFMLSHAKLLAASGHDVLSRSRAAEAIAFGCRGRKRLQAMLLRLSPRLYRQIASGR